MTFESHREDFGGRLRIGPARRKQKWGPLLKASLLSAPLRRPAENKGGERQGKRRSGASHRGTAHILHLPSKMLYLGWSGEAIEMENQFIILRLVRQYKLGRRGRSSRPGPGPALTIFDRLLELVGAAAAAEASPVASSGRGCRAGGRGCGCGGWPGSLSRSGRGIVSDPACPGLPDQAPPAGRAGACHSDCHRDRDRRRLGSQVRPGLDGPLIILSPPAA